VGLQRLAFVNGDTDFAFAVHRLDGVTWAVADKSAEIAGYSNRLGPHATDTVRHVIGDLFPNGDDHSKAEGWTGLRPMTPDGTPVLGASRYDNLCLNTGHGTLGWSMGCGSGRAVADVVLGKTLEISFEGLMAERYGEGAFSDVTISVGCQPE
jgi:glycine/D-amino acid oxidase-like deaminating enzyme